MIFIVLIVLIYKDLEKQTYRNTVFLYEVR